MALLSPEAQLPARQGPERTTATGPPQPTSRLVAPARDTSPSSIATTRRIVEGVTTVNWGSGRDGAARLTAWEIGEVDHEDTDELIERKDGQPKSCEQPRHLITPGAPSRSHRLEGDSAASGCDRKERDGSQGASHPLSHPPSQIFLHKPLIPLTHRTRTIHTRCRVKGRGKDGSDPAKTGGFRPRPVFLRHTAGAVAPV